MPEITLNKRMQVILLFLQGYSYDEIVTKTGVSKGAVFNIISELKAGHYPEISTIPEEIEQLRDLSISLKRNKVSPVKASIGLSVMERLFVMEVEPCEIEKCHTLLQALSFPDKEPAAMAKSILAIEEVKRNTGLSLEELESKATSFREEVERLSLMAEQTKVKRKELLQLEKDYNDLKRKIKELSDRESALSDSVDKLGIRETQLRDYVVELEERARVADKQLLNTRQDLQSLDQIGMSIDDLRRFTIKLKEVSAHHDVKPQELSNRLLKELKTLDKGLFLEQKVKGTEAQLDKIRKEIAKQQIEKESLHTYLRQLGVEKANLETRIDHYNKQLTEDIAGLSKASGKAIQDINNSLNAGIEDSLSEVAKLAEEAARVGKEIGKIEASIESLDWIKPMLSMIRGDVGLDDYQVRVIGLTVLRGMSSWLNENHSSDLNLLKNYLSNTILELEKWNSSKS